jgi:hypothetical protein
MASTTESVAPSSAETKQTQCRFCLERVGKGTRFLGACTFHPGRPEARHPKRAAAWFVEQKCTSRFARALEGGDFLPCGQSDNQYLKCPGDSDRYATAGGIKENAGEWTCGFVGGGGLCTDTILVRRWSCCPHIIVKGTFATLCAVAHGHHSLRPQSDA